MAEQAAKEARADAHEKALLVFAKKLADEMSYIKYPEEWSQKPLSDLLPQLWELLDHHPAKLGTVLSNAYRKTLENDKEGNINQLLTDESLPLFKNKEFYESLYFVEQKVASTYFDEPPADLDDRKLLEDIARGIVHIFAGFTPKQENEHRTLEQVCLALYPVYLSGMQDRKIGWDLQEYADFWRKLTAEERLELKEKFLYD